MGRTTLVPLVLAVSLAATLPAGAVPCALDQPCAPGHQAPGEL